MELLRPIREETERLLADKAYLESVYRAGAKGSPMLPTVPSPRSIKKWASCPADGGCSAMELENRLIAFVLLALLVALVVSFLTTPVVKTFAYKVGAIDVPKDARRMHKVPIPRLGGLAIFIGFMVGILLFVQFTPEMKSILLGAVIIVVLGVVDDITPLPALLKFVVQIVAAVIPATHGVVIQAFSNPNVFFGQPVLGAGLAVGAGDGAVDRGHHQLREPDRRTGRPGQRRVRHLRHHHAGHRPGDPAGASVHCLGGTGGGLRGVHAL